nr:hypothetical protein [Actinoplanes durhamensis]
MASPRAAGWGRRPGWPAGALGLVRVDQPGPGAGDLAQLGRLGRSAEQPPGDRALDRGDQRGQVDQHRDQQHAQHCEGDGLPDVVDGGPQHRYLLAVTDQEGPGDQARCDDGEDAPDPVQNGNQTGHPQSVTDFHPGCRCSVSGDKPGPPPRWQRSTVDQAEPKALDHGDRHDGDRRDREHHQRHKGQKHHDRQLDRALVADIADHLEKRRDKKKKADGQYG